MSGIKLQSLIALVLVALLTAPAMAADRLYSLMTNDLRITVSSASEVEIVDLDTLTQISSFSVGNRSVSSIAVMPDHSRAYITDYTASAVAVYDMTGSLLNTIPVTTPRDLALSSDGSRLYVTSGQNISLIDTTTDTVTGSLATGTDITVAVTISSDDSTLAVSSLLSGSGSAVYLVNAPAMTLNHRIPVSDPTYTPYIGDTAFTDTGRVLTWDNNSDTLYQFDIASGTQLTSDSIVAVRDGGSSANFNNALEYSTVSDRAYAHHDTVDEILQFDPAGVSVTPLGGFADGPFANALSIDQGELYQSVLHRFSGGGADTLDSLDVTSGVFTRGVYTFGTATVSARDMIVLPFSTEARWIHGSSGLWDTATNWSGAQSPGLYSEVIIEPAVGLTVTGPAATTTVDSLSLDATSGVAVLELQATGTLTVNGQTTIGSGGRLAGAGTLNAAGGIANSGEIDLGAGALQLTGGTLTNDGVLRGGGDVGNRLVNSSGGEVRAGAGQRIRLTGTNNSNAGMIEAMGGEVEFTGDLTNVASTGMIAGRDATLRFGGGLTNAGAMALSFGTSDVFGDISNTATGTIVVSGGGNATFYDDLANSGAVSVSLNSSATFFGALTGNGVDGLGDKYIEGDLRPGFSPDRMTFGGDVYFGPSAWLEIELAGAADGEFDVLDVAGQLTPGGTLQVVLIQGFVPDAGDSFDILDWGTLSAGQFDPESLPALVGRKVWSTSDLYNTGAISVIGMIPGDTDEDWDVDATDYANFLAAFGSAGDWHTDFNEDGSVDLDDLALMRDYFGTVATSPGNPAATTPEPGTLLLLSLGGLAIVRKRRSRQERGE